MLELITDDAQGEIIVKYRNHDTTGVIENLKAGVPIHRLINMDTSFVKEITIRQTRITRFRDHSEYPAKY